MATQAVITMPVNSPSGAPLPRILWFEADQPVYAVDARVSVRWWVENAERVRLTTPSGTTLTQVAHEAPGGLSFPARATGIAQLIAEGPGGRVTSGPLLVWVIPRMPAHAVMPPVPRTRVFLPLSISETARAAGAVARFPNERISAVEVLRGSTERMSSVTDVFEREVLPEQRRRLQWLYNVQERIRRALRNLPRTWRDSA